ncbi:Pre-mRNA polyadenylation factor Fip1 domain [Dillenia turbinata]|uniref:Pre-mRNA polyadenylation factor Fip1 domain n=1 Tax=Dillenia turbinata TaxID=194707 RepID=A0AAN8Z1Q1_9MAGN
MLSTVLSPSSSPSKTNTLSSLFTPPSFSDKVRSSPPSFEMMVWIWGCEIDCGVERWYKVLMDAHLKVLANRSRFFVEKLRHDNGLVSHWVEICDCDDVEVSELGVEFGRCMAPLHGVVSMDGVYPSDDDLRKRLLGEDVIKVSGLLMVSLKPGQYLILTLMVLRKNHGNTLVLIYQIFFNFGWNEGSWKEYCKLQTTLVGRFFSTLMVLRKNRAYLCGGLRKSTVDRACALYWPTQ